MSFLEQNLRVLAARDPETAERLRALPAEARLDLESAATGAVTARLDGVYLHGRHDPQRDAAAQVQREIDSSCTAVVALGFGLGYGPESLRETRPSLPLLVVEPEAPLFRQALEARDLGRFLSDPAVVLHVGSSPDELPPLLEGLPLARPGFLRLRPLLRARPAAYRAAEETIRSWLLRRDVNVNTLNRFGRLWVRNLCRNMEEFLRCPGVGLLEGLFEGIPALVVAGGPSLDQVAGQLTMLRERMLVVSVNTSLRPCLEHGVEPDFTVVVDPQFWASRSMDWAFVPQGLRIAEPSTCPRVFRGGGRFFLCSSLFPLGETLEHTLGPKGLLGAGGSVSTSAWDLARLLGARPLYAAGLDLGFPGMRSHCRGAYPESMWRASAHRLSTMETSAFASVRDIGVFPARSADGGRTPTDRRMLLYKWWFENQVRQHPDLVCRTLSASSVAIQGMPLAGVDELRRLPRVRKEIDRRMHAARALHDDTAPGSGRERLVEALRQLSDQLGELASLSEAGRAGCRELGARLARGADPRPAVDALDRIDTSILAVSARSIAGFLIQSIIHGVVGEGERPPDEKEVVSRSEAVYAGIAESAAWQRGLIERAVRHLQGQPGRPAGGTVQFR